MLKNEMVTWIDTTLKKITDLITGVPKSTVVFIPETNTTGMKFVHGLPVSWLLIAATPQDVTTLQAGTESYIDVQTTTLWTKIGSTWSSVPYTGVESTLRRNCLVIAKNTGKVYFFSELRVFHAVDTTTPTT